LFKKHLFSITDIIELIILFSTSLFLFFSSSTKYAICFFVLPCSAIFPPSFYEWNFVSVATFDMHSISSEIFLFIYSFNSLAEDTVSLVRLSLSVYRSQASTGCLRNKVGTIEDVEWVKENKKVWYHFEIFVVVFELKKKTSKPMCGEATPREFVARPTAPYSRRRRCRVRRNPSWHPETRKHSDFFWVPLLNA